MIKILILSLIMIGNAYASNGQVDTVSGLDQQHTSVVNNNFQNVQTGINKVFGLFNNYFTNSILNVASGGTGKDFSLVPANNIPYFSAKGVMGNIGIGTTDTTQFLKYASPPIWMTVISTGLTLVSVTPWSSAITSGNITISPLTNSYLVVVVGKDSAAASNTLGIRFNADTGANYSSGYSGRGGSAAIGASSSGGTSIIPGTAISSSLSFVMNFNINKALDDITGVKAVVSGTLTGEMVTGGSGTVSTFGGFHQDASSITNFSIISSGNSTGTVYLYKYILS